MNQRLRKEYGAEYPITLGHRNGELAEAQFTILVDGEEMSIWLKPETYRYEKWDGHIYIELTTVFEKEIGDINKYYNVNKAKILRIE